MEKIRQLWQYFTQHLSGTIDGRVLGLFRILYSLVMLVMVVRYMQIDLVKNMFVLPSVNFKYDGFRWLRPLPELWMDVILTGMAVWAILMALGVWFRWSARLFALSLSYFLLMDTSIYNNHLYLYALLALMLSFTDADKFLSIGSKTNKSTGLPRWQQWIFQAQFALVYFYAGVVKVKYDWLVLQEPVRTLVKGLPPGSVFGKVFGSELGIAFLNYGGVVLDLAAPLLLWYKPLRKWAIYVFVFFHLSNTQLFDDIGTFPYAMIASLIVFYEFGELAWLRALLGDVQKAGNKKAVELVAATSSIPKGWYLFFIGQLLMPLRGFFLPNDMDWTMIGQRFSWRVKMDTRLITELDVEAHLLTGQVMKVDVTSFINTHQVRTLAYDPRAARDLAIGVRKAVLEQQGVPCKVKAKIKVSRNGRPAQYFVDPGIDLTSVKYSPWEKLSWVNALEE